MSLSERMQAIQHDLKEKQAWLDARPERAAVWIAHLNRLYDELDAALADEVTQGLCVVSRTATPAKSEDFGSYDEPGIRISVENVTYVTSTARRSTASIPDIVDLRGSNGKWFVRLSFVQDKTGDWRWAVSAHEHAAYLDKVDAFWLTHGSFKQAIERFFPFP